VTLLLSSFADELTKLAEDKKKSPGRDIAKIIGSGLLGFGAGTAGGLAAGYLADAASKKITGRRIPHGAIHAAAPVLGLASGIAYSVHKAKEQEAIRRALKDPADAGQR